METSDPTKEGTLKPPVTMKKIKNSNLVFFQGVKSSSQEQIEYVKRVIATGEDTVKVFHL